MGSRRAMPWWVQVVAEAPNFYWVKSWALRAQVTNVRAHTTKDRCWVKKAGTNQSPISTRSPMSDTSVRKLKESRLARKAISSAEELYPHSSIVLCFRFAVCCAEPCTGSLISAHITSLDFHVVFITKFGFGTSPEAWSTEGCTMYQCSLWAPSACFALLKRSYN